MVDVQVPAFLYASLADGDMGGPIRVHAWAAMPGDPPQARSPAPALLRTAAGLISLGQRAELIPFNADGHLSVVGALVRTRCGAVYWAGALARIARVA